MHNEMALRSLCVVIVTILMGSAAAQDSAPARAASELSEIRQQLGATQAQLSESRKEIDELRAMVMRLQEQINHVAGSKPDSTVAPASGFVPPVSSEAAVISQEDWQLLNAKVEEHQQTKVESASKFKLKLSGLVLMNAFINNGNVDNIDVPAFAIRQSGVFSDGSLGATLRQSILGVTGFGPTLFGAKTSGDLQMDFFGGQAPGYAGISTGVARLRLARLRLDWQHTSLAGGLDTPFFTPNSPTTYVTVAEPGLANAGNLWTWVPSFKFEQRFEAGSALLKVEAGVLDPTSYYSYRLDERYATPGESSRQPAYSARVSINNSNEDHPTSFGIAGVYTPQWYPLSRSTDGWLGSTDWRINFLRKAEISGEAFVGKGVEGFGGVSLGFLPPTDLHFLYTTSPTLARMKMMGGWSQLKYRFNNKNEINIAGGYGGLQAGSLREFAATDSYLAGVPAHNETYFTNYVFRPRSDLLFSIEYRKIRTSMVNGVSETSDHVGLAAGFLF